MDLSKCLGKVVSDEELWYKEDSLTYLKKSFEKQPDYLSDSIIEDAKEHNGYAICPLCKEQKAIEGDFNYEKRKLRVNDEGTFGFCYRCNNKFYRYSEKRIDRFFLRSYHIKDEDNSINTSFLYNKLGYMDNECFQYLKNRNKFIDKIFINKYGLVGESGKIIIPFFSKSKIIYYQIRFIKSSTIKYFNPPTNIKPVYCFEYDPLKPSIFVEGVFDALAIMSVTNKYNVVAVMGLYLTDYQMKYINLMGGLRDVKVFLDDSEKSKNLCYRLLRKGYRGKLSYIFSNGLDPEELLRFLGEKDFLDHLEKNYKKLEKNYKKILT